MRAGVQDRLAVGGTFGAVVTPLAPDGEVDADGLRRLVARQESGAASAVVVLGTTGEGRLLRPDQRDAVVRTVVAASALPVICGVSAEDSAGLVAACRRAHAAGADAVLVSLPSHYRIGCAAAEACFWAVADAAPLPVLLEHMPGLTKIVLSPDALVRLAGHERVRAVVDGSGDIETCRVLVDDGPSDTVTLVARAPLLLPALALGVAGAVTPVGGYAPRLESALAAAWRRGDVERARELHRAVVALSRVLHSTAAPVSFNVKVLLAHAGILDGAYSPHPFGSLSSVERDTLTRHADEAGVLPEQLDQMASQSTVSP